MLRKINEFFTIHWSFETDNSKTNFHVEGYAVVVLLLAVVLWWWWHR